MPGLKKEQKGLIKDILSPDALNKSTRIILANAFYLKGAWGCKFVKSRTKEHEFYLLNGSVVKAPFMTSGDRQYIRAYDGFKVLRLPFAQGRDNERHFSMYWYLPDDSNHVGLNDLVQKPTSAPSFIESHIPHIKVRVGNLLIPKLKMPFQFEASSILRGLGFKSPFKKHYGFTDMVGRKGIRALRISNVVQKCYIEVDEEGADQPAAAAAAASKVIIFPKSNVAAAPKKVQKRRIDFVADHPFLFVIREDVRWSSGIHGQRP
ncbi:OLC1v1018339C2 [Oldenlandia corymbosa var. corymbosa]|uniref:OLC1v1018339C2 n=1 Tax=Oldenlandia corymbosa var. corymbosa TaxID=529605 RepID=A0AAV1EBF0_OLDCO|nr:OLC1v1018339C2 [Oldenlandia corymbosa var. corymbosa]